jgi:pimeloyl-ACP methyl ester carboxylesterase
MKRSFLVASITAAAFSAMAQDLPATDETLTPYASVADSVRLADGRNLHVVCMGEGSPTVILTAGLGDWSAIWNRVQPALAGTTRVCAWDRPGFGLSDGTEVGQTVATTTTDLEAALAKGTIKGPYILVGHSLGGYESLLFADRNRDRVVGMVLVDPSIPDQFRITERITPAVAVLGETQRQGVVASIRNCARLLRAGTLRIGGPDPDNCFRYPPNWPAVLRAALATASTPIQYEARASLFAATSESGIIVVNPQRDYGDMPLVVLTATEMGPMPPTMPEDTITQIRLFREEFARAHGRLAALSSRGTQRRVPTGHYVHSARPQDVIDAVEAVIAQASRTGK